MSSVVKMFKSLYIMRHYLKIVKGVLERRYFASWNSTKTPAFSYGVYILIILLMVFGSVFSVVYKGNDVSAQDSPLSCPLEKEIPVGKLTDQTVSMTERIAENMQIMIDAAVPEYWAGKKMVNLSRECKTARCASDCDSHTVYDHCKEIDPNEPNEGICPDGTACDPTESNQCPREVCDVKDCKGSACPFAELNTQAGIVASQNSIIIGAYNNINDIYTKKFSEFDIIGQVCKNSFLGISCVPTPKDTEPKIIELYLGETQRNVYDCRILGYQSEEEIFRQDVGETIMSCKTLRELGILKKCHRNDFYCCQ